MTQTSAAAPHPPLVRRRLADRASWQVVAVSVGWCAVIVAAHFTRTGQVGHRTALAVHLASLAVGFGTVLAVDAFGLAVLAGRASVSALLDVSRLADLLIWAGFAGLGLSGIWLDPALGTPWTVVNLWAVLVVGLNGVYAYGLRRELAALPPRAGVGDLPRPLLVRAVGSAFVSQAAWWTSILIGALAS